MNDHGHVVPNPDGSKARCGGPKFCASCKADQESLREPTNETIRNTYEYGFDYNGYFYEAMGYLSGRTHERRLNGVYDSGRFWITASQWCEYYACYRVRCIVHKHDPLAIADCYDAFVNIELPQLQNDAATTPCEVDNG